jgi:hypothetical protein
MVVVGKTLGPLSVSITFKELVSCSAYMGPPFLLDIGNASLPKSDLISNFIPHLGQKTIPSSLLDFILVSHLGQNFT